MAAEVNLADESKGTYLRRSVFNIHPRFHIRCLQGSLKVPKKTRNAL